MAAPASQPESAAVAPVPKTNRDPISSLRPAPIVLTVRGREYEFPEMPAADWLSVLMRTDWSTDDFFLDLLPDGEELIKVDLEFDVGLLDLLEQVIEAASARHWWVALRLIHVVVGSWDVMGPQATFNGVDATKLSLAAWLDAMLILVIQRLSKDDVAMFTTQLELPPPGEELPEEEMEMSMGQFLSMGE